MRAHCRPAQSNIVTDHRLTHLRGIVSSSRQQRLAIGFVRRCARELSLPAGHGPSAFAYSLWAEKVGGVFDSGHARALFGHSWDSLLAHAGFERAAKLPIRT